MSETHDILVQDIVKQLETQKPSFDEIEELYVTHKRNPVYLEALSIYFDAKAYDTSVYKDIRDYTKNFSYYPEAKDKHFIQKISEKHELGMYRVEDERKDFKDKCSADFFELAPHQLFLKNWMAPHTPYRSLLVFHGVGVGKTCSGISMAENFKDVYGKKDKRIIILASANIQIGWKRTIFTPKYGDAQCTGDTYHISTGDGIPDKKLESKTKKIVKTYYELHGYSAFANGVKRMLSQRMRSFQGSDEERTHEEDKILRNTFSDRVLIIDEVHNIRKSDKSDKTDESSEDKDVSDRLHYIMRVIQASRNLRLILLTANPMFNQPDEITWILNMMLLNDGRPPISNTSLFKNGVATKQGLSILRDKCKGYVSYLRGENPVSFPLRLYPKSDLWSTSESGKIAKPFTALSGTVEQMTFMELSCSYAHDHQRTLYTRVLESLESLDSFQLTDDKRFLQLGNMVYPHSDTESDITEYYGDEGFDRCFKETKGPTYSYKPGIVEEHGEFLAKGRIDRYSCKIATILDQIEKTEGIVFIYTNWIKGGLLPTILALEQAGYQRYDKRPTLLSDHKTTNGMSYMVISTIQGLTKNLDEELKVVCSSDNSDGHKIKVIIGSTVAAEGMDFKNVRAVHVLEPWRHINKIEQVIGRGVRNCSHKDLLPEQRNVTIYLHNMMLGHSNGSFDTYLYRYCEDKAMEIGKIEMILKEEAVDRCLFEEMNMILHKHDVDPISVRPALKGSTTFTVHPTDQPYSRICSFLPNCKFNIQPRCQSVTQSHMNTDMNTDTLMIEYSQGLVDVYKKRISLLMKQYLTFTYEELQDTLENYTKVDTIFLDYALHQMIDDQYMLTNSVGKTGYLLFKDGMFMFQPDYTNDETIPYYYRVNQGRDRFPEYQLKMRAKQSSLISETLTYSQSAIRALHESIIHYDFNETESYVIKTFKVSHQSQWGYICDRLTYADKLCLLYGIYALNTHQLEVDERYTELCEFIEEHMKPLFISYDEIKDRFEYGDKNLYGFMIYHPQNKQMYYYQYKGDSLCIVNQVESKEILQVLQKTRAELDIETNVWGFMIYASRYQGKSNGIVCKIIDPRDKQKKTYKYPSNTPGVITSDSHPSNVNLICSQPFQFLQENFKEIMKIGDKQWTKIQKMNSRITYSVMIEMFVRETQCMICQESAWLKYLKR